MINVVLHRILIKRDDPVDTEATKTKMEVERLGFAMPTAFKEELDKQAAREKASMDKGVVIQVGPTAFKDYGIESPIKVGDYISYAKFGGKDIEDSEDGLTYTVIQDEDVIAIISKKEPIDG